MPGSFAKRFELAWKNPTAEGLADLLADNVVLYQPHLPPLRGKAAAVAEFKRLFTWLPGTHSVVKRWEESEEFAFIEHVLHFPVGTDFIRIPSVDRIVLNDGLVIERVAYFDRTKLITAVIKHPSLWFGFIKYRFGR